MAIDFKQEKKRLQEKHDREKLAKKEWEKSEERYQEDYFLYPAKMTTEAMIEEAEMKDDILVLIAKQITELVNAAGIDADFTLNAEFDEKLRTREINDIRGTMFTGRSRKDEAQYIIEAAMKKKPGGAIGCSLSLIKVSISGLLVFDEGEWKPLRTSPAQALLHKLISQVVPENL